MSTLNYIINTKPSTNCTKASSPFQSCFAASAYVVFHFYPEFSSWFYDLIAAWFTWEPACDWYSSYSDITVSMRIPLLSSPLLSSSHTSFSCVVIVEHHWRKLHLINTTPFKRWECENLRSHNSAALFCPLFTCVTFVTVLISSPFKKVLWHHPRHHLGHQIWHMWEEIWAEDRQCSICRTPDPPSASSSHSGWDHQGSS